MTNRSLPALLAVGLLLFSTMQLFAQLSGSYRSLTVDDGLAQNSVWDIVQDSSGYYWFATADGINRYDGQSFKHYKRVAENSITISGNTVGKILLDSKNRIWALHNYGVSIYDRYQDAFNRHIKDAYPLGEALDQFWVVLGDTVKGLDINDLSVKTQFLINRPVKKTHAFSSRHIKMGNRFYLPGKQGVEILDVENKQHRILKTPLDFGGVVIPIAENVIFCPSIGASSYLLHLAGETFELIDFGNQFTEHTYFSDFAWYNDQLIISSVLGLFVVDPKTLKVLQHIESFESGPGFHYVESLFVDQFNTLFIGTNGNGIKIYSPYENRFPIYTTNLDHLDFTKAIGKLNNGKLVVGIYEQGLIIYDDYEHYHQYKFSEKPGFNSVPGLHPYDTDRVMAINSGDLVIFNTGNNREEYRVKLDSNSFSYPNIYKRGDRWYVNTEQTIYSLPADFPSYADAGKTELIQLNDKETYFNCFAINDTLILYGTSKYLVYHNRRTKAQRRLVDDYMKSILMSKDRIFAASQSGLMEISYEGEILKKHDVSTGLSNDFIYGVLEEELGYIWVSHNKGLTRIKPGTFEYLQFDVSDGLQSNEFNTGSYYKHTDGLLYFGGIGGVNIIDPKKLILNKLPPKMCINELLLFDQPIQLDTAINEKRLLILDYTQNTLSMDFAVADFTQPGSAQYAYMLQGLDENWIESGDRHYARYANLPPGDYTFLVKAANGDGVWMPEPKALRIVIIPPFWQTAWFTVLMVLLGLLLIAGLILLIVTRQRIKLRRELEVQHKLEMERVRISRDLHDNVGAQLSYLITNMEWIADHPEGIGQDARREQLKQLSDTGRQAITTLRQTIWAISQNEICIEEFADRFKQYAMKMVEYKPGIRLVFHEAIQQNVPLAPAVALNLFRICQEAFNNAIKHSGASEMELTFEGSDSLAFRFVLKDNGVGFDTTKPGPAGHYGLTNMQSRAKESGAQLTITSQYNEGTKVTLIWQMESNNAYAV